ncbi:MAG: sugar phosphate isomerase/epimerase [Planctomycetota bacterium]|nr:MAG: sugar phosphate isomerase/epimerase [Planctomycetota bacterium]
MTGFDRRTFMGLTIAGAAGLALGNGVSTIRRDPWIRKALKVGMIAGGETLAEKFAIARDAGFDGIELDSPGPIDRPAVLRAMEASGLSVPGVVLSTHWSKPFNHPDAGVRAEADAALEIALRDCKSVGGTSVLVVPAVVNQSMPYADAYRLSQEAMRRAVPLAGELGVSIAFENVWNNFLLSPLEAARYCDELNDGLEKPVFGWHFDIGNIVNYGWPEQWIETLGERILKLDVKDFSRTKRNEEGLWKGFGVEIGDGECGWERVRASLNKVGYRGWAAAEVGGGDLERLTDIARRMDRVFDQA